MAAGCIWVNLPSNVLASSHKTESPDLTGYREGRDEQEDGTEETLMDRIGTLVEDKMDELEDNLVSGLKELLEPEEQESTAKRFLWGKKCE